MVMSEDEYNERQLNLQEDSSRHDPSRVQTEIMREQRVSNILDQINPDNLLEQIEHRIRGEKYEGGVGWVERQNYKSNINENLISNFMGFLSGFITQNTSLSDFNDIEINNIMREIIRWTAKDLNANDELYNLVGNSSEKTRIGFIINMSVLSTLKQARGGMMAKRLFNAMSVSADMQTKKPGIKDAMMFWK